MSQPETRRYYGRPRLPPAELDEEDELDELLELEILPPPLLPPEECEDEPPEWAEECDPEFPPPPE
jgi:hypothetical protein